MKTAELVTARDIATRLSVHVRTVYKWRDAGVLPPPVRIASGTTRWFADDIDQWLRERVMARK